MRQIVHIIRKTNFEKQYIKGLKMELDYMLLLLHDALQEKDEKQITKTKQRLTEIHMELKSFGELTNG